MHANTHLSGWTHTCAKRIMPKSFELALSLPLPLQLPLPQPLLLLLLLLLLPSTHATACADPALRAKS